VRNGGLSFSPISTDPAARALPPADKPLYDTAFCFTKLCALRRDWHVNEGSVCCAIATAAGVPLFHPSHVFRRPSACPTVSWHVCLAHYLLPDVKPTGFTLWMRGELHLFHNISISCPEIWNVYLALALKPSFRAAHAENNLF
jgi:hypothetical protein